MGNYFSELNTSGILPDSSILNNKSINSLRRKLERSIQSSNKSKEIYNDEPSEPNSIKFLFDLQKRNNDLYELIEIIKSCKPDNKIDRDILGKLEDLLYKYQQETEKIGTEFSKKNSIRPQRGTKKGTKKATKKATKATKSTKSTKPNIQDPSKKWNKVLKKD